MGIAKLPKIAVILTDESRRILWVNEDFTEITGYALTEVLGKKPSLLQGPESEQEAIQRIRKGLESKIPIQDEITNYRKNGEEYTCKLTIYPIFNSRQQLTNYIAFEVDGDTVEEDIDLSLLNLEERYSSSSLKGVNELKLFSRLKKLLEKERLYLDPDLTLKALANRLDTNTKYLSQVVNHHAGHNFQHFLNAYRVEEVKQKIRNGAHQHLTLFGIGRQCGFKNKSTFYKVFKEITRTTPKKFSKKNSAQTTDRRSSMVNHN